jgi:hypothetical protein
VQRQDGPRKLLHQDDCLIPFEWDDSFLILNAREAYVAVPKMQATKIGQRPFKDARRHGISPASAMVISFGHGKWCNRV